MRPCRDRGSTEAESSCPAPPTPPPLSLFCRSRRRRVTAVLPHKHTTTFSFFSDKPRLPSCSCDSVSSCPLLLVRQNPPSRSFDWVLAEMVREREEEIELKDVDVGGSCSVSGFYNIVTQLTVPQQREVEELGFGGLLTLSMQRLNRSLLMWLVKQYNARGRKFLINGQSIALTERDALMILGLRVGGVTVEPLERRVKTTELRNSLGLQGNGQVMRVKALKYVIESGATGEKFKQSFVLYALATFLCPTTNGSTRAFYLNHVANVNKIRSYAWGTHVVERLENALCAFHTSKKRTVGGCLGLLQIWYLAHCNHEKFPKPRRGPSLPLLKYWSDENCHNKIKALQILGFNNVQVVQVLLENKTIEQLMEECQCASAIEQVLGERGVAPQVPTGNCEVQRPTIDIARNLYMQQGISIAAPFAGGGSMATAEAPQASAMDEQASNASPMMQESGMRPLWTGSGIWPLWTELETGLVDWVHDDTFRSNNLDGGYGCVPDEQDSRPAANGFHRT